MRQLLAELASLAQDNVSTPEICDIRQVIAGAAEAALAAPGLNQFLVALARLVGRCELQIMEDRNSRCIPIRHTCDELQV